MDLTIDSLVSGLEDGYDEQKQANMLAVARKAIEDANKQKRYNDEFKRLVVAYYNSGHTFEETVKAFVGAGNELSKSTVHRWVNEYRTVELGESITEVMETYKRDIKVQSLINTQMFLSEAVSPAKLEKASSRDCMVSAGIGGDLFNKIEKGSNSMFDVNITVNAIGKQQSEEELLIAEIAELKKSCIDV